MDYEIHYIWIPTEKRQPDTDGWYLVTLSTGAVISCYFAKHRGGWNGLFGSPHKITAWTPYPKGYKKER